MPEALPDQEEGEAEDHEMDEPEETEERPECFDLASTSEETEASAATPDPETVRPVTPLFAQTGSVDPNANSGTDKLDLIMEELRDMRGEFCAISSA